MDGIESTVDAKALLAEYEEVETTLRLLGDLTGRLKARQSVVRSALEELTRPQPQVATPPGATLPSQGGGEPFLSMGYVYRGRAVRLWGQTSIYLALLREIFTEMPGQREPVANALASHGSRRRYLSRDRQSLFVGKSPDWVRRHSAEIVDGWFADKNLSGAQMRTNLRRALQTAGLRIGTDVIINWRSRWSRTRGTAPLGSGPLPPVQHGLRSLPSVPSAGFAPPLDR